MIEIKPHLTAIARKTLPTPTRWLIEQEYIGGHVLDYGCGRCADINMEILGKLPEVQSVTNYDPHYLPVTPRGYYDVIICNYVLCVVPKEDEKEILLKIQRLLTPTGVAFISVRNDVPNQGHGISSKKTFQRWVELDLPMLRKTREYRMFMADVRRLTRLLE